MNTSLPIRQYRSDPHATAKIELRQLQDWIDRLRGCADEAQDEKLRALESDLLDVRSEIASFLEVR